MLSLITYNYTKKCDSDIKGRFGVYLYKLVHKGKIKLTLETSYQVLLKDLGYIISGFGSRRISSNTNSYTKEILWRL